MSSPDGFVFPLSHHDALPHLKIRPHTDDEFNSLPHVIMTSDEPWDPRCFDAKCKSDPNQQSPHLRHLLPDPDCDLTGECVGSQAQQELSNFDDCDIFEDAVQDVTDVPPSLPAPDFWLHDTLCCHGERIARCICLAFPSITRSMTSSTELVTALTPQQRCQCQKDFHHLKHFFVWLPAHIIQRTFSDSTQMGFVPSSPDGDLFKRWHTPNPALNVFHLNDDLLMDKIYSDTPALDAGHTEAQLFFGQRSHVVHIEPVSRTKSLLRAVQSFVQKWGAPDRLLCDHASNHTSGKLSNCLKPLWIGLW